MRSSALLRLMIFLISGLLASALITLYLGVALALLARAVIILPLFTLAIMALFALAKLVFHVSRDHWSLFHLVQWQGNLFWLWQVLHTGLWVALAILFTWGLTSLFGTTLLVMALNAAWIACALYVLIGCLTAPPSPALGICWRDLPSVTWREALTFSETILLLSRRLRVQRSAPNAYRDYQRLDEIVWEHRVGRELGGQVLDLDDSRPLPIRFLFELGNRMRALLPLFVSTFIAGLLLFLIIGGRLTDLGRANAQPGDFRAPTEVAAEVTSTPMAETPTPPLTVKGSSAVPTPTPEATQDSVGAPLSPEGTSTVEASATGEGSSSQSGTQTAEASATGQGSGGSQGGTQTAEASATGQGSGGSQGGTQTAEASATGQGSGKSQGGTQTAEASATGQGSGGSQSGTQTAEASATGQGSGESQSGTQTAEASATGQSSGGSQSGTQTAEASATGQGSGGSQRGTQTAEASATGQGSGGQGEQVMTVSPGVKADAQATAEGQGSGAGQGALTDTPELEGSQPPLISTPQPTIALPRNSVGRVIIEIPPIESGLTATGIATQMVQQGTPSPQGTAPRSTGAFVTPQPTMVGTWTPIQLLPNWIRALLSGR